MQILLQLLNTSGSKSSVPDTIFAAVGALANSLEGDFIQYMDAFVPYLYNALGNQEETSLCALAIGLVSDITRSLGAAVQPYCDDFMNYLLNNLRVCPAVAEYVAKVLMFNRVLHSAINSNQPSCRVSAI
jgi:importin subunit beta-1